MHIIKLCLTIPFGEAANFMVATLPDWSKVKVQPIMLSLVLVVMVTSASAHREDRASPRNPYVVSDSVIDMILAIIAGRQV